MHRDTFASGRDRPAQFSVASLFECMTLCAFMAAFSGSIGPTATGFLIAMALALGAGYGLGAMALFAAAILTVDHVSPNSTTGASADHSGMALVLVMALPGLLAAWYAWRRHV